MYIDARHGRFELLGDIALRVPVDCVPDSSPQRDTAREML
jgi:hypothetical protein